MGSEKRKHPRISARIKVQFLERTPLDGTTVNVARNGIFVRTESARALHSLVRMKLFLPPAQTPIEIFGKVAWQGKSASEGGLGVHFLQLQSEDRDRWIDFVSQVEALDTNPFGHAPSDSEDAPHGGVERRHAPRTETSFLVRFRNIKRLEEFVTRNLSSGGMFLKTPVLKQIDETVQLVLVHPDTGTDIEIPAKVVRVVQESSDKEPKGMALEFLPMSDAKNEELQKFLQPG